jgi:hypothetical protein
MNARSGLPLEIGIVRPDVVIQCRSAAGCVVPTGAGGATTTFANGFVAQLPGTINAANPLPQVSSRWLILPVAAPRATCAVRTLFRASVRISQTTD